MGLTYERRAFLARLPAAFVGGGALLDRRLDCRCPVRPDGDRYWASIQHEYVHGASITNLNNGGVSARIQRVERRLHELLADAVRWPHYAYEAAKAEEVESVRGLVASEMGVPADTLALTRNTTAGMAAVQTGFPLPSGARVVMDAHAFPRMRDVWRQRARRERLELALVPVPVPFDAAPFLDALEAELERGADLVMLTHVVDVTGQVLPLEAVLDRAEAQGVPVIVDGAQALGRLERLAGIERCAAYATSLHKGLGAPTGTGALHVHPDWIERVDPLVAAPESRTADIRKFEVDGAELWMKQLAIPEAIAFHREIGAVARADRLRALEEALVDALADEPRVRVLTRLGRGSSCGLVTVAWDGIDPRAVRDHLWDVHRVRVRGIDSELLRGVRVSPGLNNSVGDVRHVGELLVGLARA